MKIAFLVQGMGPGGTEKVVSILCNGFALDGNCVHIYQLDEGKAFYNLSPDVYFESLHYDLHGFVKCIRHFNTRLHENDIDIVLAFASKPIILATCAKYTNKLPLIVSERTDPNRYRFAVKFALKWAYSRSSTLVCTGPYVFDYYSHICKNRVIIPNPVIIHAKRAVDCETSNEIVSVGRLVSPKNFFLLIRAFKIFDTEIPGYRLRIFGDGPLKDQLQWFIIQNGLEGKVVLFGNSERVHDLIRTSKLYICSSDIEGFPNALFEAIMLGIPVISTSFPTGTAEQYIEDGIHGFTVPCNDAEKMAKRMEDILTNDQLASQMRINNILLSGKFDSNVIIDTWEKLLKTLVEDNGKY